MNEKVILDACCGGRHWWFDKNQKNTIYMDIREVEKGYIELQPNWSVKPDLIGDYTNMPFDDESFHLIAWDIPHILKQNEGIMCKKYGYLGKNWFNNCKKGFDEIMRVLKPYGTMVLKFNDLNIKINDLLDCFSLKPLFGTVTKKGANNTYFFVFMKLQEENNQTKILEWVK